MFRRKVKLRSFNSLEEEKTAVASANQTDAHRVASTPVSLGSDIGHYGSFWKRVFADLADCLILWVVGWLLMAPGSFIAIYYLMIPQRIIPLLNQPAGIIFALILGLMAVAGLLLPWLYVACFECSRLQATPGKMMLGLKVTDEQGNNIGFLRSTWKVLLVALLTYCPFLLAGMVKLFFGRGNGLILVDCIGWFGTLSPILFVLYMLRSERKQTVYDKLAKRLVLTTGHPHPRRVAMSIVICSIILCLGYIVAHKSIDYLRSEFDKQKASSSQQTRPL